MFKKMLILSAMIAQGAFALTNEEGQKLASETMQKLVVTSVRHYCIVSSMTCRSQYTYKDKTTGAPSDTFTITFYSADRQVAASEYYISMNTENKYYRIVDKTYNGTIDIERADEVQVVEKNNDEIRIKSLYMPKLGTTEYIESDLVFNDKMAYLDGATKDKNDPTVNKPVRIEYPLIHKENR